MEFKDVANVSKILLEYLPNTLKLFFFTLLFSIPLGAVVTWLKKCKFKPVSWITNLYILIMRGTPLMLQIVAVYYAIPMLAAGIKKDGGDSWFDRFITGIDTRSDNYMFIALVVAFALNYAAYFAEIFRGGIESIPKGQYEAAQMLGMTKPQTFFRIILPQVVKRVIPATSNEVIVLVKDTSLATIIAYAEIMLKAKQMMNTYSSIIPLFIAGLFYFVLNAIVTLAFVLIEKHYAYYK
ncbi:MAG: amino acid ABC transporter permease [Ruminococcus sp.]|nr:amino acid ABC transporter permease [Ruminococcus sp.]